MNTMNRTGSIANHGLRVFCCWLVLGGQALLWTGACNQTTNQGNTNTSDNTNTNTNTNSNDNDNSGDVNSNGDFSSNGNTSSNGAEASIDGFWISTRGTTDTVWGLAAGTQLGDSVTLTIDEADGSSWNFNGAWDGDALDGTCMQSPDFDNFDFTDLAADPPPCRGEFSEGGTTLTLTADENGSSRTWMLEKPAARSPSLTGSWTDESDSASRLVSAYDGNVLAVVDPDDVQRRFDAVWSDSGGFVGSDADANRWTGLPYDDGDSLFVWIEEDGGGITQYVLARQNEPSTFATPITGRWMSSWNTGESTNALRGQASVIFDGTDLFVYQRDDSHRVLYESDYDEGGYWSIFATFDGATFQSTADSTTLWTGHVDSAASAIYGHWNDDDARIFGFVRAATSVADLTGGTWSSLSADYETPSEPTQSTGEAQATFDGTTLTIRDTYDDTEYVIEADWMGDHFRGEWWPVDDPDNRLRWSGEIVQGGTLIHGKWERGEWSFSPFAIQSRSALADADSGTLVVVTNPFEPIAASFRDDTEGFAISIYRSEGVTQRFNIVGPGGTVEMTVDDRYRPVSVVGPDLNATFVWADDSSSVNIVAVTDTGTTVEDLTLNLSDASLLTAMDNMATLTGVDGVAGRAWIADNPGRFASIMRGDEAAPSFANSAAKVTDGRGLRVMASNSPADVDHRILTDGATLAGLIIMAVAAESAAVSAATLTLFLVYGGLAIFALTAIGFLVAFFIWDFLVECFPCTLACFWNCGVETQRRACCLSGGSCITATQEECSRFGGLRYVNEESCSPNPCN